MSGAAALAAARRRRAGPNSSQPPPPPQNSRVGGPNQLKRPESENKNRKFEQTNRRTVISKKNSAAGVTSLTVDFGVNSDGSEDDINPVQMKLGWIMGFRLGKYTGSTAYVSEGLCDFKGSRYVFLSVDDFNNNVNNYFTSAFTSSILNNRG